MVTTSSVVQWSDDNVIPAKWAEVLQIILSGFTRAYDGLGFSMNIGNTEVYYCLPQQGIT